MFFSLVSYTQMTKATNWPHLSLKNCPQYHSSCQSQNALQGCMYRWRAVCETDAFQETQASSGRCSSLSSPQQQSSSLHLAWLSTEAISPSREHSNIWRHGPPCPSPYAHKLLSSPVFLVSLLIIIYQPFLILGCNFSLYF